MKRMMMGLLAVVTLVFSLSVFAEQVGVVDMQSIFHSSPEIQKINSNLTTQFSSRREAIMKMGKALQDDMANLNKNKMVMKKSDLSALQNKIAKEGNDLKQAQAKFQQDLYSAQNKSMEDFMNKVKMSVQKIAGQKKLDLVLPKNTVLYSQGGLDITADVLSSLK